MVTRQAATAIRIRHLQEKLVTRLTTGPFRLMRQFHPGRATMKLKRGHLPLIDLRRSTTLAGLTHLQIPKSLFVT